MIYKLNKSEYHLLNRAMNGVENFPEVYSILNQINPGEVYVDDDKDPRSALIWNQGMQGHYFIGESENVDFNKDIKEYIDSILINQLLDKGINWFEISGFEEKWEPVIEELFRDKGIKYDHQFAYRRPKKYLELKVESRDRESYIKKLTVEDLESNIENRDYILNELEQFWGTVENFNENGICYYATENNIIVSVCYSGFKANGLETIGIETLSDYRKKGYAFEVAMKFIDDCTSRNSLRIGIVVKTIWDQYDWQKN